MASTPAITITVIYDNHPGDVQLQTAWGFACLVEGLEQTILFDTGGDGALLLHNMGALGIDPGQVDVVVLSHVHQDHTGGLAAFLSENADVTVYLPASFPQALKDVVLASGAEVVAVAGPTGVCAGASVTGELGTQPKEMGLLVEGPEGVLVITGCAHPGIVDIVAEARAPTGLPVDLVLGGFHLGNESAARIGAIVEALTALGVRRVAPGHCTGDLAIRLFEQAFGEDFIRIGVGSRVSVGLEVGPAATPKPRR